MQNRCYESCDTVYWFEKMFPVCNSRLVIILSAAIVVCCCFCFVFCLCESSLPLKCNWRSFFTEKERSVFFFVHNFESRLLLFLHYRCGLVYERPKSARDTDDLCEWCMFVVCFIFISLLHWYLLCEWHWNAQSVSPERHARTLVAPTVYDTEWCRYSHDVVAVAGSVDS